MPFGSFVDLTSSIIVGDPKRGKHFTVAERGVGILARPQSGGKPDKMGRHLLDINLGRDRQ